MITIDGKEYRTLEEQVKWLTDNMGTGGGTKITEINVGKPDAVVYDSTDGALITCQAEVSYDDETSETIDFEYYVPIIPGSNITIDASDSDDRIVISATGGGASLNAGLGIEIDSENNINVECGDGLEIDEDDRVAVKVDNSRYIGFGDEMKIGLNNAGKNAIEAVQNKLDASALVGTHDGTNWTALQIKGVTKNIPSGGGGGGGQHLYRHSIRLTDEDGEIWIYFQMYTASSAAINTQALLISALGQNKCMYTAGGGMDGYWYALGVYYDYDGSGCIMVEYQDLEAATGAISEYDASGLDVSDIVETVF